MISIKKPPPYYKNYNKLPVLIQYVKKREKAFSHRKQIKNLSSS